MGPTFGPSPPPKKKHVGIKFTHTFTSNLRQEETPLKKKGSSQSKPYINAFNNCSFHDLVM